MARHTPRLNSLERIVATFEANNSTLKTEFAVEAQKLIANSLEGSVG